MGCSLSGLQLDPEVRKTHQAPRRTFKQVKQLVKISSVYDGDTLNILTRRHPKEPVREYPLRVYGIDTPELRTSNPLEKQAAHLVTQVVKQKLRNKVVWVEFTKEECYGRLMGVVFPTVTHVRCGNIRYACTGIPLSTFLMETRLARPYKGKRKKPWTTEELQTIIQQCKILLDQSKQPRSHE